jgi:hypothetical protein
MRLQHFPTSGSNGRFRLSRFAMRFSQKAAALAWLAGHGVYQLFCCVVNVSPMVHRVHVSCQTRKARKYDPFVP